MISVRLTVVWSLSLALAAVASAEGEQKKPPPSLLDKTQPPPIAAPAPPPDVAAPPADAIVTSSGLATKLLRPGRTDGSPGADDIVTFHYDGWTADGRAFESTTARGRAAMVPVDRLMEGLAEGLRLMTVGEKRRLWVPEALAFKGQRGRPAGMLVFDVELLAVQPSPRVAPPDLLTPPADAERSPSGLVSRVLRAGTGTARPGRTSRVTVHYTGWTTDGEMFDSSVLRGEPATFGLDEVIKGWTEGLQLMQVGEKRRLWIPSRLAYNNEPGRPRGMLVFDVELIRIDSR